MKKVFTKIYFVVAVILSLLGETKSARAQTYLATTIAENVGATAVTKDSNGNVFVIEDTGSPESPRSAKTGQIVEYLAGSNTGIPLTGTNVIQYVDQYVNNDFPFGIAVDHIGNIFVTTFNDLSGTPGDPTFAGNILKFTKGSPVGNGTYNYSESTWVTGNINGIRAFGGLVVDSQNNLFVTAYDATNIAYELVEYPAGSTNPSVKYQHLGDGNVSGGGSGTDSYSDVYVLAIDGNDNIYAGITYDASNNSDGGKIVELSKLLDYTSAVTVATNPYCLALACDGANNLYAINSNNDQLGTISLVEYMAAPGSTPAVNTAGVTHYSDTNPQPASGPPTGVFGTQDGGYYPFGLAITADNVIFASAGSINNSATAEGDLAQLTGAPGGQAGSSSATNVTSTTATLNWANGSGAQNTAVFLESGSTGTPTINNSTTYTAATGAYTNGGTAGTGWYCVYSGSGTSVSVSGLTAGGSYRFMVAAYNGTASVITPASGDQNYITTTSSPTNPLNFSTSVITPSGTPGSLTTTTGTASASTSFTVSGSNLSTGNLTVTAPTGFDVSSDNSSWSGSGGNFTVAETGSAAFTVYVRLDAGDSPTTYAASSVSISGGSATTATEALPSSQVLAKPVISSGGSPSALSTTAGTASSSTSFTVSGVNMQAGITVTPPTGFEVSKDNSAFTSTVTVGSSGTIASTTVYIRLAASDGNGTYSGNIVLSSTSATSVNVSMPSSTVTTPAITDNGAFSSMSTTSGTASSSSSITVSGSNLTTGITVTANYGFDVSLDNSTWSAAGGSKTIPESGGAITNQTVYVRLDAGDGAGFYTTGNVALTTTGATTQNVPIPTSTVYSLSTTISSLTAGSSYTNSSVTYTATFAAPVSGLSASDFTLAPGSIATASVGSVTQISVNTFTIVVNTGSGDGTVQLEMNSSSGVSSSISNLPFTGTTVTVDKTAPTVTIGPPSLSYINSAATVRYTVIWADANLDTSSIRLSPSQLEFGGSGYSVNLGKINITGSRAYRTVSITGVNYDGNMTITIPPGTASDNAGNSAAASNTSPNVVVDNTPPTVTIGPPSVSYINSAATVSYTVTWSDANLNTSSISLSPDQLSFGGNGYNLGNVSITGSGNTRTVSITGVSGDGTMNFSIPAGTASDLAGNYATASNTSTTVTVDNTPPVVTIGQPSTTITNTGPVTFDVSFSDANFNSTSFNQNNVTLNGSGATGAVSVTQNSSTDFTVTVSNLNGNGTIGISVNPGTSTDLAGNTDAGAGPSATFTVDNTPPTVSISPPSVSYANSGTTVNYTVTFNDANLNDGSIHISPFDVLNGLVLTGTAAFNSITANPPVGNTVLIQLTANGDGTLAFSIPAGAASDEAGNQSPASSVSMPYTVDNTPPVVTIGPPSTTVTNTGPVTYDVSYSDANFNSSSLSSSDITLNSTGGASASVAVTQNSTTDYTVTLSGVTGNGSLGISVAAGTSTDLAGNTDAGAGPSTTFTINNTPPTVQSITATTPSNANPTNATSVTYTVTFSEAVTGVSASAFTATTSGVTTTGIVVTPVSGSVYSVAVNGISGTGTLRLDLNASGTGITDAAGNAISGGFTSGDVYNINQTPPTFTSLLYTSNNGTNSGFAQISNTITLSFGTDEAIQTPVVTIAGHSVTATNTGGNNYTASYVMTSSDTEGRIPFTLTVTDLAGNSASETDVAAGDDIIFDMTPPVAAIGPPTVNSVSGNGLGSVTYVVTYSDANFNTSTLTNLGINVYTTGTVAATLSVTGGGTSYNITFTNITGAGKLSFGVKPGYATDDAGNFDSGVSPSQQVSVLSSDASLAGLTPSAGALLPSFSPTTTSYNFHENYNTSSITLTPVTDDPNATVTVDGNPVASGTASGAINLNTGNNTVTVVVTAQDGVTQQTYTLNVNRTLAANDNLTSLAVSNGALSPAFVNTTSGYSVSVPLSVSTFSIKPTTSDPNATVTVNGSLVTSGTASSPISLNAGPNAITVVVTAANGVTKNTFTVTVTQTEAASAQLTALSVSPGQLTPIFNSATNTYSVTVNNNISSITVTPTTADPNDVVTVNGATVTSGTASGGVSLNVGSNSIPVAVTAPDGTTTQTYTLNVTRTASSNANLLSLATSSGVLSPVFNNATAAYTVGVPMSVSSITVTPTTANAGSTVTVNGSPVSSGNASSPISLNPGPNTITVVVTAANGTNTNTFTLTVTQTEAASAMLTGLVVSPGQLTPKFSTTNTSYNVTVNNYVSTIAITPTAADPNDVITVNGITVTSGTASGPVSLNVGSNAIPVVVTAPDGTTMLTYTVNVTRVLPSNSKLLSLTTSSGKLSPVFNNATGSYNVTVPLLLSSITVTPTTADPAATVTVNGSTVSSGTASSAISLNPGPNTITVVVTAGNGVNTNTFTLTVTPTASTNDNLSALSISTGQLTPLFNTATDTYNVTLNNTVSSISLTPTTADATATVTVNGAAVTSGTASGAISINVGANAIPVVVTAQDGVTTQTYTVNVTRVGASNDNLFALSLSSGTLSPAFAVSTTGYTASVANSVASITVTPTASDPNATITVDGSATTSGTASASINLAVGSNTVTIVVTASNGVNNQTYTVTFTRAAGGMDVFNPISVTQPTEAPSLADDGILVHQGVSPNGDGIEDFLQIDNISQYPDNHLMIMNRSGQLVYDTKGYNNSTKVFDGHSNKTGQMQLPGTYFFALDYTVNGIIKHKTGFLVLKY